MFSYMLKGLQRHHIAARVGAAVNAVVAGFLKVSFRSKLLYVEKDGEFTDELPLFTAQVLEQPGESFLE